MQVAVARIVDVVKTDPAVDSVMAFTGGGGATNSGNLFLGLKPLQERKISASAVIDRLRPKLQAVPGANTFMQAGQDLRIGGRGSSAQYQYTIQSDNLQDLVQWGPVLLQQMRKLRILTDVNTDQQNSGLQMMLAYDRATASRLGITPQTLDSTFRAGRRRSSERRRALRTYHRSPGGQSPGPIPLRDRLFQSRTRRGSERCLESRPRHGTKGRHA
jgi:multidrug efflux pump